MITVINLWTLCILALLFIGYFIFVPRPQAQYKGIYLLLFFALTFVSIWATRNYVYPPERIFKNTDYHVLALEGFEFERPNVVLVDNDSTNSPLWDSDTKQGKLLLSRSNAGAQLQATNFHEPIFVKKGDNYELVNPTFEKAVRQKVAFQVDTNTYIEIGITNHKTDSATYTVKITTDNDTITSVSKFGKYLKSGYAIWDILQKTDIPISVTEGYQSILLDAFLVRRRLNVENSDLCFQPSYALAQLKYKILIDDENVSNQAQKQRSIDLPLNTNFFTGFGVGKSAVYKIDIHNSMLRLLYAMPNYQKLKHPEKDELKNTPITTFLTSTSSMILDNDVTAGYYFPFIEQDNSVHHFKASLSYFEGSAKEEPRFRVASYGKIQDNDSIPIYRANQQIVIPSNPDMGGANWLFKIKNFKNDHILSFGLMAGLLIFMFTCIAFIIVFGQQVTQTEFVVYTVLMTVVTVRNVINWRFFTFPPVEHINLVNFDQIRNPFYVELEIGLVILFFVGIVINRLFGITLSNVRNRFHAMMENLAYGASFRIFPMVILVAYILFLGLTFGDFRYIDRLVSVFFPLLVFFITDYYCKYFVLDNRVSAEEKNYFTILRVGNWLLCFGSMAIADAGFAVIFLLATLIVAFFKYAVVSPHQKAMWLSVVAIIIFVFWFPRAINFIFEHAQFFSIGVGISALLFAAYVWKTNLLPVTPATEVVRKAVFLGLPILIALAGFTKLDNVIEKRHHIKHRATILYKNIGDIITGEDFESRNSQKILETAQNKWLIDYYYSKSDIFNTFKLIPHFEKGSTYTTQAMDLVTVRYVIGEHSELLVFFLLGLWFSLLMVMVKHGNSDNLLTTRVLWSNVLLFSVALFTWMASTNRFVFFGQDFPMISLISLLTLVFTMTILFMNVIGVEETTNHTSGFARGNFKFIGTFFIGGVILLGVLNKIGDKTDFTKFDIAETVEKTQSDFERLNERFKILQSEWRDSIAMADDKTSDKARSGIVMKPEVALEKLDQALILSKVDSTNTYLTSRFSRSLFKKFKEQIIKYNSPEQILHLRRPNDTTYVFAMNNQYYRLRTPDADISSWKGSIKSPNIEKFAYFSVYKGRDKDFRMLSNERYKGDLLTHAQQRQDDHKINMEIPNAKLSMIPFGWTLEGKELLALSTDAAADPNGNYHFIINNNQDIINSNFSNNFAHALKMGDVITFTNKKRREYQLHFSRNGSDYLAKNVWLNGRQRFFYPLGEKCFWAYQFANLMAAADSLDPKKDIDVTLDPNLTEKIYNWSKKHYSTTKYANHQRAEMSRSFSLVVLDGHGRIKAINDYKKGNPLLINPNRIENYQDALAQYYMRTNMVEERKILGNKCLLHMEPGPGSSIKPIIYSAVASQYNLGWGGLALQNASPILDSISIPAKGEGRFISWYAGRYLGRKAWLFSHPKYNIQGGCDNATYLPKSSNVYHSLVLFLGSFTKESLVNRQFLTTSVAKMTQQFPAFALGGIRYYFKEWPDNFNNNKSILSKGIWYNYEFAHNREAFKDDAGKLALTNIYPHVIDRFLEKTKSSYKLWSFPEVSNFSQADRQADPGINGVKQSTVGSFPIQVTPLKMAEMAGKLISLNRVYRATMNPKIDTSENAYKLFDFDESWNTEQGFIDFNSSNIYAGMYKTGLLESPGVGEGTAHRGGYCNVPMPNYTVYYKTGTINSALKKRDGDPLDNKHLLMIISQKPLHNGRLTKQDLRKNKFYVLYFSFYNEDDKPTGFDDLLKIVLQSAAFKDYMK